MNYKNQTLNKNNWRKLKLYLNLKREGVILIRKTLIPELKKIGIPKGTVDIYISSLIKAGFLSRIKYGVYKLEHKIPEEVTISVLEILKYRKKTWEDWFMPFEDLLRIRIDYIQKNS